jgi:hypothetical protein
MKVSYNYDTEKPEWDYEVEDNYADEAYDKQRAAIAHFPIKIQDKVRDMNQAQAVLVAEELLKIKKQTALNRGFAESIYGDALGKMPRVFTA